MTVVNDTPAAADALVRLELPRGWSALPLEQPVKFTRTDEAVTVRFQVKPAAGTANGVYHVKASAVLGGQTVRMPVAGSALPAMSGTTRPGQGAFAATPAPVCHGGRAKMREHQLPPPLHVVDVLHWAEFEVE